MSKTKKVSILVAIVAVTLSGGLIAHQTLANGMHMPLGRGMEHGPAISGTVSAISGNILSVSASSTVYSVEAGNAKIVKNNNGSVASTTISGIAVGDTVRVEGTISGTNVTAKMIFDGDLPPPMPMGGMHKGFPGMNGSSTRPFMMKGQGHGFPMMMKGDKVSGSVSLISGNTLTVASSSATYTIDATHARISGSNHRKGTLSGIQIGDNLNIFGMAATSSADSVNAFMIDDTSRSF